MRPSVWLLRLGAGLLACVTALRCQQVHCSAQCCPAAAGHVCPCVMQCPCQCASPSASVGYPAALRIETVEPPRPTIPPRIVARPSVPKLVVVQQLHSPYQPYRAYQTHQAYSAYAPRPVPLYPVPPPVSAVPLPQSSPPIVWTASRAPHRKSQAPRSLPSDTRSNPRPGPSLPFQ